MTTCRAKLPCQICLFILLAAAAVVNILSHSGKLRVFWMVLLALWCVEWPWRMRNLPTLLVRDCCSSSYILTTCSGTYAVPFSAVLRVEAVSGCAFGLWPTWLILPYGLREVKGAFTDRGLWAQSRGIRIVTDPSHKDIVFSPAVGGPQFVEEHLTATEGCTAADASSSSTSASG